MKAVANIFLIIAAISLIVGVISRLMVIPIGPMKIQAHAFLQFTNTCLLAAIAMGILGLLKAKA